MNTNKVKNHEIEFMDFTCFNELLEERRLLMSLVRTYQEIFAEPDVWAESYSHEQVLNKLKYELTGYAVLRVCIEPSSRDVIGFCWAQQLNIEGVLEALHTAQYFNETCHGNISIKLKQKIDNNYVIYLHDLGIKQVYRNTLPLEKLILPTLEGVAKLGESRELMFWSVKKTCVAWLAQKVGIKPFYTQEALQFFHGALPQLNH